MPYTEVPRPDLSLWAAPSTATAALLNAQLRDIMQFVVNAPSTMLTVTAAGTMVSGTTGIRIPLDTVVYDNNSGFTAGQPRILIQCPGVYLIYSKVGYLNYAGGLRNGMIRKNSAGSPTGGTLLDTMTDTAISGAATSVFLVTATRLVSQDYIELFGWQSSGSTQSTVTSGSNAMYLAVQWLGV